MSEQLVQCCRRLIAAVATDPVRLCETLEQLAAFGDVHTLRTILDYRLIETTNKEASLRFVKSVLDILVCENPTGGRRAAQELARDWVAVYAGSDPSSSNALSGQNNPVVIEFLLQHGSDPNMVPKRERFTALGVAYWSSRTHTLDRLLEECASREVIPMMTGAQSVFQYLLEDSEQDACYSSSVRVVIDKLREHPGKWEAVVGEVVCNWLDAGHQLDFNYGNAQTRSALFSLAKLPKERWRQLAETTGFGLAVALYSRSCIHLEPIFAILDRALAAGMDIDSPIARLDDGTACSMLLAAAERGRAEVVEHLLNLGADPFQIVISEDSTPKNAFSVAYPDTFALLASWRSRRAMGTVRKGQVESAEVGADS